MITRCEWRWCEREPVMGLDLPFAHAALCQPHYDEAHRRWDGGDD